jgi:hypothetical protein
MVYYQQANAYAYGHQEAAKWRLHRHSPEPLATDLERTLLLFMENTERQRF